MKKLRPEGRSYQNRLPGTVSVRPSPMRLRSSTIAHGAFVGNAPESAGVEGALPRARALHRWGGPHGPALRQAKFSITEQADGGVGRGPGGPPHPTQAQPSGMSLVEREMRTARRPLDDRGLWLVSDRGRKAATLTAASCDIIAAFLSCCYSLNWRWSSPNRRSPSGQ